MSWGNRHENGLSGETPRARARPVPAPGLACGGRSRRSRSRRGRTGRAQRTPGSVGDGRGLAGDHRQRCPRSASAAMTRARRRSTASGGRGARSGTAVPLEEQGYLVLVGGEAAQLVTSGVPMPRIHSSSVGTSGHPSNAWRASSGSARWVDQRSVEVEQNRGQRAARVGKPSGIAECRSRPAVISVGSNEQDQRVHEERPPSAGRAALGVGALRHLDHSRQPRFALVRPGA